MDRGYAVRAGAAAGQLGPDTSLQDIQHAFGAFEDVVIHDLIPTIDGAYRTIPDREHRAMAGLSMGGMQALFVTLRHLDKFAYIGSLSGPILRPVNSDSPVATAMQGSFDTRTAFAGAFADPQGFNKRVKLFWLGVGSAEPEQFHTSIRGAAAALQAAGVRLRYFESSGTAHEWQTWRRDLNDLAPLLFR
jgi:enterochelin esterase family protein